MSVLSAAETQRVEATIADVERHTSAEIVVATLPCSDHYPDVRLWTAVAFGLAAATCAHAFSPALGVTQVLLVQLGAFVLAWFLSALPPVLRWLLPKHRSRMAVERAAELAFLENGVFATEGRTGVLILLSELEHKVTILGDRGIHAQLQAAGWETLVGLVTSRIREGRTGDGLCEVIERLGKALAESAPAASVNPDELENRVRTGRRKED